MGDFDRLSDKQIAENAKSEAQWRGKEALREAAEDRAHREMEHDGQDARMGYAEALVAQAQWVWDLYVTGSCICDMDYGNNGCTCQANWLAQSWLTDLLGDHWHDIMRDVKGII